jgi:hypothetical protein
MAQFRRSRVIARLAVAALSLSAASGAAIAQVRNLVQPGAFAITAPPSGASFEKRGRIERQTGTGWEAVFDEFYLVDDCRAAATLPACVTLAPGGELRPVPWNGYSCEGQCPRGCKKNVYRPPGTFRLVLTACGRGPQVTGEPFVMGGRARH